MRISKTRQLGSARAVRVLVAVVAAVSWWVTPTAALAASPTSSAAPAVSDMSTYSAACATPPPGYAMCFALRRTDIAATAQAGVMPGFVPSGYGPSQLQSAYNLPSGSAGSGLTVAVVDAYDLPDAESSLATYRSQFSLPACSSASGCFRKVDQNGGTSYPASAVTYGWAGEIALDLDMVSAICPNCKILLVEATTSSLVNLAAAEDTAVALGANAVSNSYGSIGEWAGEASYDAYYNHPGVIITAATGDCGYLTDGIGPNCPGPISGPSSIEWPAASRYVLGVGGTSLHTDTNARGWSETAWSGTGSGCSVYESKPSWQTDPGCSMRTSADISAVADPLTGVAVYDSHNGGWNVYGGTSAATPIIAAAYMLAGQPVPGSYPFQQLYTSTTGLNDVTSGSNGSCGGSYLCTAGVGYDGPTGMGTPWGISAFAPAVKPDAPTAVIATPGNAQALVSWTAPAYGGSSSITGYTVTSNPGSFTCGTSGATSCVVGGLTNGQSYTFTVTATNLAGTGPPSLPSASVIPDTFPDPPTGAAAVRGNLSATVSWAAPVNNGGSTITLYTVTSSPGGLTCNNTVAGSCTVSGLTLSVTYTFTVTATNSTGQGLRSDPSNSIVAAAPPGKPTAVTGIPSDSRVLVSWTAAPANNSSISNYTVTAAPGGLSCSTSGATSCTVAGLTNGIGYRFTVVATNGIGIGAPSDQSGLITPLAGATYHTVAPYRVLDSRIVKGASQFHSRVKQTVLIATVAAGVPTTAVAVTGNVTIVNQTAGGYVAVAPSLTSGVEPGTSTINFPTGDIRANGVTVPLAAGGNLDFMYWVSSAGPTVDVLFDVTGYFSADASGATYHTLAPSRVLDSRSSTGGSLFHSQVKQTVLIATVASGVPANALAVTGNVTVVGQTALGYVAVAPSLTSGVQPGTSTINFPTGDIRANGVTVPLAAGGNLDFMYWVTSTGPTVNVLFDVTGYFSNDATGATYHTLVPYRVLDSRISKGGSLFHSQVKQTVLIATVASGVPTTAVAVTGNVTIVNQSTGGYVTVAPSLTTGVQPGTSTINFPITDIRANGVTAPLASGGNLDFMYWVSSAGPTTHVIFDVTGYFAM
ncbi:MAG: fibronectin type III domain-containing protein [Candidatus Limnocylindrales bacterium]